jgi:hypothetical protein
MQPECPQRRGTDAARGPASRLRAYTQEVIETATGYAIRLPEESSVFHEAFELALLERRCCPFLRLELTLEPGHGPVWFTRGGAPGVKAFLATSSLVEGKSSEANPCCP